MVNPDCLSLFKSRLDNKKESLYLSSKEKPLGQSRDNSSFMPSSINKLETAFGKPTEFCELKIRRSVFVKSITPFLPSSFVI